MTIELERTPEKAIREQKAELERLQALPVLERDAMKRVDAESPLAQAVVGMRRAGKSVVCRRALKNAGIPFGYVDFDDETLAKIPSDKLDAILQIVREVYGDVSHFLFDEIQNIEGWHLFVNRLLRNGNHVVITGSNARLLTSDLATHLTGRHIPIEILPFSYFEYCEWLGRDTAETWKNYFFNGGLPETFSMQDLRGYVAALYNSILSRDILGRHKVRNAQRFMDAAYVIMQQYAREVSYDRLAEKAGVSSAHTMQTYVGYLAESYLVFLLRKYSTKPAERIRNEKIYVADPSFISYFMGVLGSEEELGWRLENIVYLELLRRRKDSDTEIFYYKDQSFDIDFCLVRHGRIVGLIQVAYTLDGVKTRKREIAPLFGAARKLGCSSLTVITDHERETIGENGLVVEVLPAREWLALGLATLPHWQH
jgi:predicted AAA+ superfamily ATPase